ncbi:unnamed protein product [Ceratitis capitata]|uniref:(Mediterranean fruit fly) hypothetical protein n=1 Tax=Ceratitis capitata TaxID=7213 RepID=A0A811UDG7_CERCA|nr:unnamed protein product [Ceratitis capitata]
MPEMGEKSSGNKVKKSKNDLFRSSLGYYLKKKSFVGNEKFHLQSGNSFGFSNVLCITNNHHIVDQQFGETYEAPLPTKINGCSVANDTHADQPHATTPHTSIRFATLTNDTSADPELLYFTKLIQTLSACTKLETAESDPDIVQFRSSKYEIHTTEAVVEKLRTYLEKRGHVLILNLLYSWIHLHVVDNEVQKWSEEDILLGFESPEDDEENKDEFTELKQNTKRAAKEPPEELMIKSEKSEDNLDEIRNLRIQQVADSLQNLRTCREQILKSHTQHPYIIKLTDRSRGLSCADVDSDECHLVADTICRWEINNYGAMENETEDQIEFDVREHEKNCNGNNRRKKNSKLANTEVIHCNNEYGGIELRGHGAGVQTYASLNITRSFIVHLKIAPFVVGVRKAIAVRISTAGIATSLVSGRESGGYDLTARLWSLERDFPLITFAGHTQDVVYCLPSKWKYMATGSADLSVRVWLQAVS